MDYLINAINEPNNTNSINEAPIGNLFKGSVESGHLLGLLEFHNGVGRKDIYHANLCLQGMSFRFS